MKRMASPRCVHLRRLKIPRDFCSRAGGCSDRSRLRSIGQRGGPEALRVGQRDGRSDLSYLLAKTYTLLSRALATTAASGTTATARGVDGAR